MYRKISLSEDAVSEAVINYITEQSPETIEAFALNDEANGGDGSHMALNLMFTIGTIESGRPEIRVVIYTDDEEEVMRIVRRNMENAGNNVAPEDLSGAAVKL